MLNFIRNQSSHIALVFVLSCFSMNAFANMHPEYDEYCTQSGGQVEWMPAEFLVNGTTVIGQSKSFCNFYLPDAFVSIGLETFSSPHPSIAATLMKSLKEIDANSPLMKGDHPNPSHNVCKNLGGATIGFVADGGFANHLGQSDICVFGDGSMVSGWSLMYMANHREGYDEIKNQVKADPINIHIPN